MSTWEADSRDVFQDASCPMGLQNEKPDFNILHDALDWQKLKVLNKEDRNTQIVKRANLYMYNFWPPLDRIAYMKACSAALDKADGPFQKRPDSFIEFPLEKLQKWFPVSDHDEILQKNLQKFGLEHYPDVESLRLAFDKNMELFRAGKLCKQLETLVRKLFETKKIDKIVAFGAGRLVTPWPGAYPDTLRLHSQHAILLVMRDVWKKVHPNDGELAIYIQDMAYRNYDVEAADSYGMKVVNGIIGHEVGWTLLDESTFLVGFNLGGFQIQRLAFEITRPAAIFEPFYHAQSGDATRYTLTLEDHGEELEIPLPGVHYGSETLECFQKEYHEERLDLEGMDGRSLGTHKDAWGVETPWGVDGCTRGDVFRSSLGFRPTLYTRV